MKKLFFFGCLDQVGHYWAHRNGERPAEIPAAVYNKIDGSFTPTNNKAQGIGKVTKEGTVYVIAWHDYTVDKRGGSNSNIIGYGYSEDPNTAVQEMWEDFKQQYPRFFARQTEPVSILNLNCELPVKK